jgi:Flp pilus assembly protein TadD
LLVLTAASAVVTFIVQRQSGAVSATGLAFLGPRLGNAMISYWRYIGMTLWPRDLAVIYPVGRTVNLIAAVIAVAALVLVTVAVFRLSRRHHYLAIGWLWYLGTLVPVIGLVQVGMQSHADRYTYIPTIGLLVAGVWGVGDLVARSRAGRIAVLGACVIALGALAFATTHQVTLWKNTRTLFGHTLAVTRDNPGAHSCYGTALAEAGDLQAAMWHYREALRIQPENPLARNNLGTALARLGRYPEAVAEFRASLRMRSTPHTHHNLGLALFKLGRVDEAIAEYEAALRFDSDDYPTVVESGAALAAVGRLDEAEVRLRHAVELQPRDVNVRLRLAGVLARKRRVADALKEFDRVLRQSPDHPVALNDAAWLRATSPDPRSRDGELAVRLARHALDLNPHPNAQNYGTLAAACAEAGRFPDAVNAGERAVELAKAAGDPQQAGSYAQQLARYRVGKPLH